MRRSQDNCQQSPCDSLSDQQKPALLALKHHKFTVADLLYLDNPDVMLRNMVNVEFVPDELAEGYHCNALYCICMRKAIRYAEMFLTPLSDCEGLDAILSLMSYDSMNPAYQPTPTRRKRRRGLELLFILGFLACLVVGVAALGALWYLRAQDAPPAPDSPMELLDPDKVLRALATRDLAGDDTTALIRQALQAGEIDTAVALLLSDRREYGAGLVPPREPGDTRLNIRTGFGLTARLSRRSVLAWTVAVACVGTLFSAMGSGVVRQ